MKTGNKFFNNRFIWIASIAGIMLLLILQYLWFRNSYEMFENDILEKCAQDLRKAVDDEMFERMNNRKINFKIKQNEDERDKKNVKVKYTTIKKQEDINTSLQDLLLFLNYKVSINRLNSLFNDKIKTDVGYIPKYNLYILNDTISKGISKDSKYEKRIDALRNKNNIGGVSNNIAYDKIVGKTIIVRISSYQIARLDLISAKNVIFRKASYIFITSILLIILICLIFIFQLKNMLNEKQFVKFLKEYTSALTHDLKGPLNNINMASTMLCNGKFDSNPEIRTNYYHIFKEQSEIMLKNIDKILSVSVSEQRELTINKERIKLKPYLEKIVKPIISIQSQNKDKISIEIECNPEEIEANIDAEKMENVFNNLIENSIKYSYESVQIIIKCAVENNIIRISVADNGMGIPAQDLEGIFKKFHRANQIERKRIYGYGLGLSFVKAVIYAHGGQIKAESNEGKGSIFIIELPS